MSYRSKTTVVESVIPARPESFFKEGFPTSGNDKQNIGPEIEIRGILESWNPDVAYD
jgi:hypothetical protein